MPFQFLSTILLGLLLLAGTQPTLAQKPLGIDVSSYQGNGVNWASVKSSGISFAWAKATEGEYDVDADFAINESNGKAVGIYMGAYDFCRPDLYSPSSEASYFWGTASQYTLADGLTLMPMLDFETFNGYTGSASYADWANQWCEAVTNKAGLNGVYLKPVIYISACKAGYLDSSVLQWGNDIANYGTVNGGNNPQTGSPWSSCSGDNVWGGTSWNFWQYESVGSTPGVSGNCDEDVYNGSASGLFNLMVAYATSTGGIFWYWDPQGTTGGNPYTGNMSGYWESNNWSTTASGQASPVGWTEGKCCIIAVNASNTTPAFTITMNNSHTVAGFFDGGVNGTHGGNVTLTGPGIISMAAGAQGIDVPNSYDSLNISNTLAGTGQVVPEGSGALYLNGTNTYSGGTQIGYSGNPFTGILYFNNSSSFSTGGIVTSNCSGCAIAAEGSASITITNAVTIPVAGNINFVGNPAGVTFSGPWALNNSLIFGTGGAANNLVTVSGPISGSGAFLQKTNVGILALSGTNTYSGATTVGQGTLIITGTGKLGNGSYAGKITNNTSLIYSSTASQTFSGVVSGTGSLTVSNGGVLALTAANTYTGNTTVAGGSTLQVSSDTSLGASTASLTLNGGCLKNNNSAPTLNASRTITLGANGGYVDAGWAPSNPVTINSKLTGSGSLLINMDGSPVVLANTANNYSGDTVIGTNGPGYYASGTQAWLKLGAAGVIPNGPGAGNVDIYAAYKGLLDLAGFNQTINGLNGDGTINNSTGSSILSVGNNNSTSTFNGVIENVGGTLALTKIGTGILTLNGTNTYSGVTTINAGTLALGAAGSISNSPTISIAAGATFDVSALSEYFLSSSTTLSASGTASPAVINGASAGRLSLGSQPIVLNYDGSHPALTIGQGELVLSSNPFTVNGSVLPVGTYTLIQQASGNVVLFGNCTVTGSAIGAGTAGTISVSGGNVNLIVRTLATFSNLAASPTVIYGTTSVTLSGTVSAAGPMYPAQGETVSISVNGNAQSTTVNDSTGDFSISYNPSTIPASTNAYTITYSYNGNSSLSAATDTTKTLTVNKLPATLTGKRPYDGTATAAAAILSVANKVGSDVVTLASGSGTLAGTNVGTQTITSFGSLTLGGVAAGNYTLTGASGSVIITAPPFSISSGGIDITGSNFIITWQSAPGATYQVFGSTDATASLATWTNVGGPIVASNTVTSVTNPITGTTGFFGVKGQ